MQDFDPNYTNPFSRRAPGGATNEAIKFIVQCGLSLKSIRKFVYGFGNNLVLLHATDAKLLLHDSQAGILIIVISSLKAAAYNHN